VASLAAARRDPSRRAHAGSVRGHRQPAEADRLAEDRGSDEPRGG
jgi:hypothetical protein